MSLPSLPNALPSDRPAGSDSQDQSETVSERAARFDPTVSLAPGAPGISKDITPGTPASFGRYEVRRSLGAGGYGDVFLGHDTQLDRPVAIKVLRSKSEPVLDEGARPIQEARKLARLRHPGIVTVHDVGVQEGQMYIVSDYLDGPDLGHWLRDNRPSWSEAARITASVADALAHAHTRLIVHRDITIVEQNDERFHEAELHRLKGELQLVESDNQSGAEECFHTSIETARRQQSKAWELRSTTSIARLWQRQGRQDDARAALAAVYDTYTEGFKTPDLIDARALLESLAGRGAVAG